MAKAFTTAGVVGFRRTDREELLDPIPAGAEVVSFDEETNAALLADLGLTTQPYSIAGGVLLKNGVAVVIAGAGDRKGLLDAAAQAVADNDAYLALANPTNAQVAAQVRRLTQQNSRIIKRLVQLSR